MTNNMSTYNLAYEYCEYVTYTYTCSMELLKTDSVQHVLCTCCGVNVHACFMLHAGKA